LFYGASFCFVETILAPRLTFAFYLGCLFEKKKKKQNQQRTTNITQLAFNFQPVPWFLLLVLIMSDFMTNFQSTFS